MKKRARKKREKIKNSQRKNLSTREGRRSKFTTFLNYKRFGMWPEKPSSRITLFIEITTDIFFGKLLASWNYYRLSDCADRVMMFSYPVIDEKSSVRRRTARQTCILANEDSERRDIMIINSTENDRRHFWLYIEDLSSPLFLSEWLSAPLLYRGNSQFLSLSLLAKSDLHCDKLRLFLSER